MTRFRFVATVKLSGLSSGDLITKASELEAVLFDEPVFARPKVVALPQSESIALEALVDSNPTEVAKAIMIDTADTTWGQALRKCQCEPEERSATLQPY